MAEQDNAQSVGNIELAIQQALMESRTITVGRVIAYRERGAQRVPVVDVQVAPRLASRIAGGNITIKPIRNVPVAFWQAGEFTMSTRLNKGDHVLCIVIDREKETWMSGDGTAYDPGLPGMHHDLNDMVAFPFLTPDKFQPSNKPGTKELFLGDKTGKLATIRINTAAGGGIDIEATSQVTVKAPIVNLEASQVNVGAATNLPVVPVARLGVDGVLVPPGPGHPGGTFPIINIAPPSSAHLIKG